MRKQIKKGFLKLWNSASRYGKVFWTLAFIISILAIFFRFYNVPDRYGFDPDPVRDSIIAKVGAETLQFPLSGPVSGIAPFTFGPWYYYFLITAKILLPFDYSSWILIGIFSLGFVMAMYKIGETLEGKYFGLMLAFLAAISPAQTGPSAGLSNPNMVPLHAALTILLGLYHIKKNLSWYWLITWGAVYGIGVNHHYQMAGLILVPILFIIANRKNIIKSLILFVAGVLISFIPLFIFNLTSEWHTVRGIIYYLTEGRSATYIPNSWTIYIKDFLITFWGYLYGVSIELGLAIWAMFTILIIWSILKRSMKKEYLILFGILLVHLFVLRYLISQRDYYYYLFLHPLLFLYGALGMWILVKRKLGRLGVFVLLVLIFVSSLPQNWERLKSQPRNLEYREAANRVVNLHPGQKFSFFACKSKVRETYRERGLFFYLDSKNLTSSDGMMLGILTDECSVVDVEQVKNDILIDYSDLGTLSDVKIIDLNSIEAKNDMANEWIEVNSSSVYEDSF